jgi:hypothetical protein
METISSSLTFFFKFVFAALWSGAFGLGTVTIFFSGNADVQALGWLFAAVWVVGTTLIWWTCARFKRVKLNGTSLVISNYRDEITVPAVDIADVRQNRWINLRPITLTLKRQTPFGRAVTFMPRRSFRLFSEDEIVTRLRRLANIGVQRSVLT